MSKKPWFWLDRQGEDYCLRVKGAALRLYPEWEQGQVAQLEEIHHQAAEIMRDCETELINLGSGPQPQAAYDGRPAWESGPTGKGLLPRWITPDKPDRPAWEGYKSRKYGPVWRSQIVTDPPVPKKGDRPVTARVWPPSASYCTCYEDPRTCWQHGEQDYR